MAQAGEDKLTELRSRYEETVLGEIRGMREKVDEVDRKVNTIELALATANLAEVKADVKIMKEVLTRNNVDKLTERVQRLETFQTKLIAILGFVNVLLAVFAIFKDYIIRKG